MRDTLARVSLFDRGRDKNEPDAAPSVEPDEDALRWEELTPQGGEWNGLLFDNPNIGLSPVLTPRRRPSVLPTNLS